jgi:acyl-[acyl-carrier-protein]-phospholipid O-acyltransferase/long-chain-fatty-acid--[acyl-carrier-protein] ligase
MLSHNNIAASVNAIRKTYRVNKTDVTLGILPFFHAFGYSATLWLPLATDMAAVYHFDPFGTKAIGMLARKYSATVLYATPTFLKLYVRRCNKEDLATLDLAVVGAEKLGEDLAVAFADKFGATPVEGYGTTELSPWAAVNVPPHRTFETGVVGSKLGTVGRVLPEMEVKTVEPESRDELKTGEAGLLLVRGPNVMLGYLNQPEKTAEVIQDGWYDTGDFAKLDADGFITITGRQSRFSKIGGETVPHEKVEKLIARIAGGNEPSGEQLVAVTAVPDSKKGERLIVVHKTLANHSPDEITKELAVLGLPNLWIPRPDDFVEVDEIPLTSMGKVDLGALKKIAAARDRSMML